MIFDARMEVGSPHKPTSGKHQDAKAMSGFGSAGVREVAEEFCGDTYRAVYTVKFPG